MIGGPLIPKYKKKANFWLGIGFLTAFGSFGLLLALVASQGEAAIKDTIATGVELIRYLGLGFWSYGCSQYARGKGYSPWFGLVGLLTIFGLIFLAILPTREAAIAEMREKGKAQISQPESRVAAYLFSARLARRGLRSRPDNADQCRGPPRPSSRWLTKHVNCMLHGLAFSCRA